MTEKIHQLPIRNSNCTFRIGNDGKKVYLLIKPGRDPELQFGIDPRDAEKIAGALHHQARDCISRLIISGGELIGD